MPVLSVTKHSGFVASLEYFKKQVFSRDTKNYKVVKRGQFAYATIHLDEGSIALLEDWDRGAISPMYTVFEAKEAQVESRFLIARLKSPEFVRLYGTLGQGTVNRRKSISFKTLSKVEVPLPPLPEQRKIAAILSSVDDAIEKTQAVIDQVQVVKKGLMQELLTRGIPERHTRFKKTEIGEIPEEWGVVTLGDITLDSAFGPRFPSGCYNQEGNFATLRTTDLEDDWEINYETMPLASLPEDRFVGHVLQPGDLLISRSGTCGIACVFEQHAVPVLPGAFLIRFRLNTSVIPRFIQLAMMTPWVQAGVQAMASGGVQKNLSGTNLKTLLLPRPAFDEQEAILTFMARVDSARNANEQYLRHLKITKIGLTAKLLTGELRVAQEVPV